MNNAPGCRFKLCNILLSNFLFLSKSIAGSEGSEASVSWKDLQHRQQLGYGSYVAYITLPCISCSVISCRFNGMKVFVVDPCISGVAAGISAGYMKHSGIYNPHPTSHTYTHTQTYKQTNRPCPLADNRQLILYTNCENGPVFTHFNSTQGRAVSYICGVKCVRISCGIKQLSYFPRPD